MSGAARIPRPPSAVLQVLPRLDPDGPGRSAVDLARHLRRRGWRALVASAGGALERELAAAGATHLRLPLDRDGRFATWRNAGRLARAVRTHRIAVVHAHAPGPARSALKAARRAGAAFVTTCHELYSAGSMLRRDDRQAMAGGDRVIAVSDFLAEALAGVGQIERARLRVVRRWIDPVELDPERVRGHRLAAVAERCGLGAQPKLVAVPGALVPASGHLLMLAAMAMAERTDFAVLFTGGGAPDSPQARAILSRLSRSGLADRVRFAGAAPDLPAALALADLVVVPATQPDPSGVMAAAAQAMGKPVIVTDQGALAEAVMPAATGWLVPPDDPGELARAIDLALSLDQDVRRRLAARARAFVLGSFGMDALCDRTLEVYRELLSPVVSERHAPAPALATAG